MAELTVFRKPYLGRLYTCRYYSDDGAVHQFVANACDILSNIHNPELNIRTVYFVDDDPNNTRTFSRPAPQPISPSGVDALEDDGVDDIWLLDDAEIERTLRLKNGLVTYPW